MAQYLTDSLEQNLQMLTAAAGHTADLTLRRAEVGGIPCCLVCCEGMYSAETLAALVLTPLGSIRISCTDGAELLAFLQRSRMLAPESTPERETSALLGRIFGGFAALLAEGADSALTFGVQGYALRGIAEPSGEQNLYGAKEGFTESVRVNMSQIRRRLRSPELQFTMLTAGSISQTDLCICFLRDRVPEGLPEEICRKLSAMPLETVLSAGYLRPYLEQSDTALIHSTGMTERPDILCAKLLEGRVGILTDGTPFAVVIPQLFCESFQTLDDYIDPPAYATLLRWLKYGAALIALLLPAAYLAISLWHPEYLHETLLRLLTESEQNAPFSLAAELLGILFVYETVREAGLRLPKAVGSAVGIIGGLLIGDAAVQSGLISTPVLTVAALSVTAGFVIPEHHAALTVLRPLFILAAALSGLPGIAVLGTAVLCRICAAEIFGFPVSAPVAPLFPRRLGDILARIGFRSLSRRNFNIGEIRAK